MPTAPDVNLTEPASRESFAAFCRLLYARHLVTGAGGNACARCEGGIFATPTGWSLRDITPEQVLFVAEDGSVEGPGQPSKELAMHLGVLASRPDVQVVCHAHGSYITSLTTLFDVGPDTLPPLCPGQVYYAWPLPMLPYFTPGAPELASSVAEAFADKNLLALLLKNHGLITVGDTLADAINIAEEVDEGAMIWSHTRGEAKLMSQEDAEMLRGQRLASGGGA